jgi:hypothetical protein
MGKGVPPRIREAWAGTSLLFLGYRLADWDFRVLFRSILSYLERSIGLAHVSVQLVPGEDRISEKQKQKAQEYLLTLPSSHETTCKLSVS